MTKRERVFAKLDGFTERQRLREERKEPTLEYLRAYAAGYRAATRAALRGQRLLAATLDRERLKSHFPHSAAPTIQVPR